MEPAVTHEGQLAVAGHGALSGGLCTPSPHLPVLPVLGPGQLTSPLWASLRPGTSKVPSCSDSQVPRPGLTQQVWSCTGNLHPCHPAPHPQVPGHCGSEPLPLGIEGTGTGITLNSAVSSGSLCSPSSLSFLPSVMGHEDCQPHGVIGRIS